jgi:hypothetical protein
MIASGGAMSAKQDATRVSFVETKAKIMKM